MNNLNDDPESYSDGIRWFTAAGHDAIPSALLYLLHHESSDPLVGITRAKLSFAVESPTFSDIGHSALIKDADETFPSVETWLRFDSDSDGDGLDDDMETYRDVLLEKGKDEDARFQGPETSSIDSSKDSGPDIA
ncbi:unnamed protein product [marine sediment metagenome]|uniref:Uncharacterized protein n=1 Tax=marine sediment metagenome TaxID=412755 RepID=X1A097_9ZZZZ